MSGNALNDNSSGSSGGGFWDFMGDLLGAGANLAGNLLKKPEAQVVYYPQTPGISTNFLYAIVIGIIILVAIKLFKGK